MARRRFRYNRELDKFVEIIDSSGINESAYVQGDITPFVSVVDGVLIESRSQLRDYMGQRNLVHHDPTNKGEWDRYEKARDDQRRREMIWEGVDRVFSTGRGPSEA